MSISPFVFTPAQRKLIVYKKIRITLEFSGTDMRNTIPLLPSKINKALVPYYKSLILNYDVFAPLQSSEPQGYLIIVGDNYYSAILPYVFWKRKMGYNVILTKVSQITNPSNPDTLQIKNYIRDMFNTLPDLSYMLLVGDGYKDDPDIPLFRGYPHPLGSIAWSDYYYSLLAGSDNYPEVAIGRFNVASVNETQTMVDKHFKYERNVPANWNANKVLLVAHKEEYPHKYTACKRWIEDNVLEAYSVPFDTAYGGAQTNYATNQFVKNKINAGLGLVNYRGHGYIYEWWEWNNLEESFITEDVRSLNNSDHLPIVLNISCSNGAIQQGDYESLVEAWTLYTDGGGVAALGATRPSYTYPNHDFDEKIFRKIYGDSLNIGNAINAGKILMINNHDSYGLCNARIYILDGDPTLWVWTDTPKTLSVTHSYEALLGGSFFGECQKSRKSGSKCSYLSL